MARKLRSSRANPEDVTEEEAAERAASRKRILDIAVGSSARDDVATRSAAKKALRRRVR